MKKLFPEIFLLVTNFFIFQMRNHSYNIKLVGGVERRDPNVSIPGTWSKHSNQNIKESQGIL